MSDEKRKIPEGQRAIRSGGRNARRALRAAPLDASLRPIKPGMSGGNFKPLDNDGVKRIHEAALETLATIGLADAPESGQKTLN